MWVVVLAVAASVASERLLLPALVVVGGFWSVRWLASGRPTVRTPLDVPIVLLVLLLPVTLWATAWPEITIPQVYRLLTGIGLYYALVNWATSPGRLRVLLVGAVGSGVFLALLSFVSVRWFDWKLSIAPHSLYQSLPLLVADTIHPNVMAGYLVLLIPYPSSLLLFHSQHLAWPVRGFLGMTVLVMGGVILLSLSRGALVALVATMLVITILRWRKGGLLLAGTAGAGLVVLFPSGWSTVLAALERSHRLEMWVRALAMLQDFPLTGIGMGAFLPTVEVLYPFAPAIREDLPHAHNLFLQVGIDLGIVGLLAWCALVGAVSIVAWQGYRQCQKIDTPLMTGLAAGVLGSQVALVVHGLGDAITWGMVRPSVVPWALWGMGAALWRLTRATHSVSQNHQGGGPRWWPPPWHSRWLVKGGILVVGVAVLVAGPALVAHALGNVAMLGFRNALLEHANPLPLDRPAYVYIQGDPRAPLAAPSVTAERHFFERALNLAPQSRSLRWGLGRLLLATGDAPPAAQVLAPVVPGTRFNPLLQQDILLATASAFDDQPERVIALSESLPQKTLTVFPSPPSPLVGDVVAWSYLQLQGAQRNALDAAQQARPMDLYANYHLWKRAVRAGRPALAASYQSALQAFPLDAIKPADERLLPSITDVIPLLEDDGLWQGYTTLYVAAFLVWQYPEAPSVGHLLEHLIARAPGHSVWPFYLGEWYHRQGKLAQAERAYRQALGGHYPYERARLRLGMIAEAQASSAALAPPSQEALLMQAATWYDQYLAAVPADLAGLTSMVRVCAALEGAGAGPEPCNQTATRVQEARSSLAPSSPLHRASSSTPLLRSPSATLQGILDEMTNQHRVVAELLNVPEEHLSLGENLAANGELDRWNRGTPEDWSWIEGFNQILFSRANFTMGAETVFPFEGQRSARIHGFWVQNQPGKWQAMTALRSRVAHTDAQLSGAGVSQGWYVLSFSYRTVSLQVKPHVRAWEAPDPWWLALPDTYGTWRRAVIVAQNQLPWDQEFIPIIQSYAPGILEVDALEVRPISVAPPFAVVLDAPKFRVLPAIEGTSNE
jgi:putative inorganic carbon (HCO3(-)) transporter